MPKSLVIFLTHDFKPVFLNTLVRNDKYYKHLEMIVLFDSTKNYDESIDTMLKHIKIFKMDKAKTSYDQMGHAMYINYFKKNMPLIEHYDYFWIIENDVFFPIDYDYLFDKHRLFNTDLLVTQNGCRWEHWYHKDEICGFKNKQNLGVFAFIMRFSKKFLTVLINNIDVKYYGYLEALLPNLCIEENLTISQFLPCLCGLLSTDNYSPFLKLIERDILEGKGEYLENKLYHPIKL
jgi:hypothetical protein